VSDEAVPSWDEVFDIILMSSFSMWGLSFDEADGAALSTRRKRR
jgi:hypothetical protein